MKDTIVTDQGRQWSNRNGTQLEATIADILARQGWQFKQQFEIGRSLWGGVLRSDLFVAPMSAAEFPSGFVIECRWQSVSGSADEKLAYLWLNIAAGCYPVPVVVIADGRGARPQALVWLRARVDRERLARVFDLVEFLSWINRQPRIGH
jgi:hypothetical protein